MLTSWRWQNPSFYYCSRKGVAVQYRAEVWLGLFSIMRWKFESLDLYFRIQQYKNTFLPVEATFLALPERRPSTRRDIALRSATLANHRRVVC